MLSNAQKALDFKGLLFQSHASKRFHRIPQLPSGQDVQALAGTITGLKKHYLTHD